MDPSHHDHKSKKRVNGKALRREDHLKEKTLHAHDKAIPEKDKVGHKPHHEHDMHHGHGDHAGHGDHHRMMIADFRRRFWISLILSVPVILLSPMVQHILGFELNVPYAGYIAF
jgi:Cu2+-exporting ATPase